MVTMQSTWIIKNKNTTEILRNMIDSI